MTELERLTFPSADFSRVPYGVFTDPANFEREQERVFRGPVWCYVGLEVEVPNPGDFLVSYLGATQIVLVRDGDGRLGGFVNRCAHRGTQLVRATKGNARDFTCVYHQWSYDLNGNLTGIPFRRGLHGVAGMPADFDMSQHGLRRLRVESYRGVVFATLSPATEPLVDYLDTPMRAVFDRIFARPIEILGYSRQRIPANWKLYLENLRDPYHAGLLHQFSTVYGLFRATEKGGTIMDKKRRHEIHFSVHGSDRAADTADHYTKTTFYDRTQGTLGYPEIFSFIDEPGRGGKASDFMSIFPNAVFQQLANSLATRQVRPRKVDEYDLYWTYFGYADDPPAIRAKRLEQANLVGPAGFSSMEDGEVGALVQRGVAWEGDAHSIVMMGGVGPIEDQPTTLTEMPIRGFWRFYSELMGLTVEEPR